MRIEIDTKHDTKEELAHLANMLKALASSTSSGSTVVSGSPAASRLDRKLARRGLVQSAAQTSTDPQSSSGDLFNLFSEDSSSQPAETVQTMAAQPHATGDMFSLFSSSPGEQPAVSRAMADLLDSDDAEDEQEIEPGKTSVKDILDDDRIVPY